MFNVDVVIMMYERQSRILRSYAKIIKNKLDDDEDAIALVDNVYALLETKMTYNQFISISKSAFIKGGIDFDVLTSGSGIIFFIFKYPKSDNSKSNKYNIYTGEGRCSLCDNVLIGSEHHIKPRAHGGTDDSKNLVFLCVDCHNAVELFCSYCENSKTICDKQMFNSCWRRNNVYFLQTSESKEMFDDINDIPKLKIERKHRTRKMKASVKKCMICRKTFPFQLNRCKVVNNVISKLAKTILQDKHDPDIIYVCDDCYSYALMMEKAFGKIKENQKCTYERINSRSYYEQ